MWKLFQLVSLFFLHKLFECVIFTPKEKKFELLLGLALYPSPGPANGGGTRIQLSKCIWLSSVSFGMWCGAGWNFSSRKYWTELNLKGGFCHHSHPSSFHWFFSHKDVVVSNWPNCYHCINLWCICILSIIQFWCLFVEWV